MDRIDPVNFMWLIVMKRKRKNKFPIWWSIALGIALLAIGLVGGLLYCSLTVMACDSLTYDQESQIPHRRVGLVLGCSPYVASGRDNLFFVNRIKAAAALFHAGKVDYLLVSGDNRYRRYNEPLAMEQALIKAGVPAKRIVRDYAGFTTLDSVIRARDVFGEREFAIISQRFHTQRAVYLARGFGIDAIGFNAGEVSVRWAPKVYVREVLARARAVWDVKIWARKPHFLGKPIPIG